jgi:AcrR family transcriptional regulator
MDRRRTRRDATRAEILAAAWELVRAGGLAGLSLRELGARVGMRAQSLYSYFGSKDEIYDAMFRQGWEQYLEWMGPLLSDMPPEDPVARAVAGARRHFDFSVDDPVRHELLFQRTIPGFTPSPQSYAVAVDALQLAARAVTGVGMTDPDSTDLWTAVLTGLTNQQIANDPGGVRWERLIERAVHMLIAELAPQLLDEAHDHRNPRSAT